MSSYRFIASDKPLPEIDLSGFVKLKVKDIKTMDPMPKVPVLFDEMDDESEIFYALGLNDIGGLVICVCDNPPYDLDYYIRKSYVYWLEGNLYTKWMYQLTEYLNENITKGDEVELWSIGFCEGKQIIKKKKIDLQRMTDPDLEMLQDENCCIRVVG